MKCLEYPFDSEYLLKKRKKLKKMLLENATGYMQKRVAIHFLFTCEMP